MANEAQEQAQGAAEDAVADMLFGQEDEYEPSPEPAVEGDEAEPVEASEETEASDDAVEPTEEFVQVEYEGKLYEVPNELKEALLRQNDYTQKTQQVAEQRKAFEVGISQIKQAQEQYEFVTNIQPDILKAQQLEATAEQYHQYLRDNVDSLSPTEIEKIRLGIDDARTERDNLVKSLEQRQQEFQQAQQQSFQEMLNKGTEVLRAKIPTWGEESQKQMHQYALDAGFTEAEISNVVDPRQVEVLWKASQYDNLMAGKSAAVKKVQNAPQIKPKSRNPMPKDVQDKLNLQKKLKSDKLSAQEKASLVGESIASRFGM